MLADAPELAHLAGAWEDFVGEGGHSLSAMQARPLALPLTLPLALALTLPLALTLTLTVTRAPPLALTLTLAPLQARAADLLGGADKLPFFCWERPRAREGYYRLRHGVELATARAKAYAPHADLIWMETAKPEVEQG